LYVTLEEETTNHLVIYTTVKLDKTVITFTYVNIIYIIESKMSI